METAESTNKTEVTFEDFKQEVIADYRLARISRELSLLGRREVLTGKAKFGIFGDGKELPQIALAKQFENGPLLSVSIAKTAGHWDTAAQAKFIFRRAINTRPRKREWAAMIQGPRIY